MPMTVAQVVEETSRWPADQIEVLFERLLASHYRLSDPTTDAAWAEELKRRIDDIGRGTLQNGDLLLTAEAAGFEVIVTTDQNLRYQQNLSDRRLAILVLLTTDWHLIRQHTHAVSNAVNALTAGAYVELPFPPTR